MSFKDCLLAIVIVIIWGFNFVVISWGVEGLPPLMLGALRFLLVALLGVFFVKRPQIPLRWMAAYALTLCFGQFAFLFSAMNLGMPAGLASAVLQSQALFTLIFSALILKETIKLPQILALLVAGLGLWQIGSAGDNNTMTAIGFGLTLASAASWALGNVCNRKIAEFGYKADLGLVVWSAWIPPIPFLLCSYIIDGPEHIVSSLLMIDLQSIFALLYLALMASIVGYSLWSYLISKYPAGQVAPLTLAVPVVGISCSFLLLDESIILSQWIGIALVLFGLAINMAGGKIYQRIKRKMAAL